LNLQFGDTVKHPLANLAKNIENFKIVANLPYSIAGVWLEHVLALDVLPRSMVLIVQNEAGEHWIAQAGTKKFSPIAIFLQSSYDFISKIVVPKKSFYPQPKVDSWLMYFEKPSSATISREF
jgi:16S rRNA (adenine1518-N6/adenine1519-N6)-dimethyltransferase